MNAVSTPPTEVGTYLFYGLTWGRGPRPHWEVITLVSNAQTNKLFGFGRDIYYSFKDFKGKWVKLDGPPWQDIQEEVDGQVLAACVEVLVQRVELARYLTKDTILHWRNPPELPVQGPEIHERALEEALSTGRLILLQDDRLVLPGK